MSFIDVDFLSLLMVPPQHIDALKKENFNIKLKVHFLEERLAQLAPDQIDAALKQNINLKIEVQQYRMEIKKHKRLVLELERELEKLQRTSSTTGPNTGAHTTEGIYEARARELEEKLEEREREVRELRKRLVDVRGGGGEAENVLDRRRAERTDTQHRLCKGSPREATNRPTRSAVS